MKLFLQGYTSGKKGNSMKRCVLSLFHTIQYPNIYYIKPFRKIATIISFFIKKDIET
jgi:hypothetical protein